MKYKTKETNLKKLKNYINANTETKTKRETKRICDEMRSGFEQ